MDTPIKGWTVSACVEGMIEDLEAKKSGHIVSHLCVVVPGTTKQLFHGARLIDAHSTALTLKQRVIEPNQMLVGVGYSLGAIVLNNYVASYGKDTALDAAVSISGSLNCYYQRIFQRSQRTWQPMIAAFMKDGLLLPKWGRRIQKRLGPDAFRAFLRASTIVVRILMVPKVHSLYELQLLLLTYLISRLLYYTFRKWTGMHRLTITVIVTWTTFMPK
jgi:hypothetical protein